VVQVLIPHHRTNHSIEWKSQSIALAFLFGSLFVWLFISNKFDISY
jgi:hypothetical protein